MIGWGKADRRRRGEEDDDDDDDDDDRVLEMIYWFDIVQ